MRDDFITIRPEDVTSWISIKRDRIALPYKVTDDLLYYTFMAILDTIPYSGDGTDANAIAALEADCMGMLNRSTITATLKVFPYRKRPLAGIELTADVLDGRHLKWKIHANMERGTAEAILDRYFSIGAAGLSSRHRDYWSGTYQEYKGHSAE